MKSLEGMDLIDRMREVSSRMRARLDKISTEEATKNALVMPFINHVLGYHVFDPSEVVPEFTADVGTKKGEKVDYALLQDDTPVMLFECKRYGANLDDEPASQLYRYFSVTQARFGVLTDGVIYRFYSDLVEANKMDTKPFFELNMLEFNDAEVEELRRFTKTSFDLEQILSTAKDLKYTREIKRLLANEWSEPSEEFVRYIAGQVYDGSRTKAVMDQFTRITKKALSQFLADRINDRLTSALQGDASVASAPEESVAEPGSAKDETDEIVTIESEWQGYFTVKAILSQEMPPDRVKIRDRKSYCGILLDGNNRQPVCRLHFNRPQKYVGLFDEEKTEQKVPIDSIDDIFKYSSRLQNSRVATQSSVRCPACERTVVGATKAWDARIPRFGTARWEHGWVTGACRAPSIAWAGAGRVAYVTRRRSWSAVSASTPNMQWHITLEAPRTRTWRPPNSSLRRPLTRSPAVRSL